MPPTPRQVKARLGKEGWVYIGGTKHDRYRKGKATVQIPRHAKDLTPGTYRNIAKTAGWK